MKTNPDHQTAHEDSRSHGETASGSLGAWLSNFKKSILSAIGISSSEVDLGKWQNEVFRLGDGTSEGDTKAVTLLIEMLKDPNRTELAKKIATQAKPFSKASPRSVALYKEALVKYAPELHGAHHSSKKAA